MKKEITIYECSLKKAIKQLQEILDYDQYSKPPQYTGCSAFELKSIRMTKDQFESKDAYLEFLFELEFEESK
jgi:hypothetical protein